MSFRSPDVIAFFLGVSGVLFPFGVYQLIQSLVWILQRIEIVVSFW